MSRRKARGRCAYCGGIVALRKDFSTPLHNALGVRAPDGGVLSTADRCPGSHGPSYSIPRYAESAVLREAYPAGGE